MKKKSVEKETTAALPLAMPLILPVVTLLLCAAIILICGIRPYEKLHTYLQIAFMDDLKQTPSSGADGLEIVQNDITTTYSRQSFSDRGAGLFGIWRAVWCTVL